jgi:hypothetical protein
VWVPLSIPTKQTMDLFVCTDFHVRKRHVEGLEQGKKRAKIVGNYAPPVPAGIQERGGLCYLDANTRMRGMSPLSIFLLRHIFRIELVVIWLAAPISREVVWYTFVEV